MKKTGYPPESIMQPHVGGRKKGLAPGTPVFVGEQKQDCSAIDVTLYNAEASDTRLNVRLEDIATYRNPGQVLWINVNGLHDVALIEAIGREFDLHSLTLEDIVNTTQRPKTEEYENYIFLVLKMITYDDSTHRIDIENLSLVLMKDAVISFQERDGDIFDPLRNRIHTAKGRTRKSGPDYLVYALMDAVIDEYFATMEKMGEHLETIDNQIVNRPERRHLNEVHRLKREILFLRKSVWPLREVVSMLEKEGSPLIDRSTRVFLRDLYDHTIQAVDIVETYRDILGGMHDTYLSSVNYRLNDTMKILTTISTIFIPLTFIVGVYGMNFDNIPELHWHFGYYGVWALMLLMAVSMLAFFWKKGWFRS